MGNDGTGDEFVEYLPGEEFPGVIGNAVCPGLVVQIADTLAAHLERYENTPAAAAA